ncbi:hypothetical protein JB92DRAFT_3122528 [Gautieria morchelliformis]|nr:hypothetical protein JB92DRAFT_3122528 [Gautieria morchelliformis]
MTGSLESNTSQLTSHNGQKLSQEPWQSHPQTYRSEQIQATLMKLDTHRVADQNKQLAAQKKGGKFAPWVIGKPVERKLPVVEKNSKRIRREGLDQQWIKTQLEDELKLRVYDPIEDGIDGAADSIIDPELLGLSAPIEAVQDPNIDPRLQGLGGKPRPNRLDLEKDLPTSDVEDVEGGDNEPNPSEDDLYE